MKWASNVDLLTTLSTSFYNFEISCKRFSSLVIHLSCSFITDPRMSASAPRIYPQNMCKPEIFPQGYIYDLDRHGDKRPASMTYVGLVAARSNLIVVCQVDIEHQLFGHWAKSRRFPKGLPVSRICSVHRPDLETRGIESHNFLSEPE